ncbi:aldo/keto reductase [Cohnella thailandensis]|uniref:Aldo/keto reductase n=1 Tax=Cohnella thailandensis TaxID=557557 RepID=A0A841SYL1_9BACL|nr:aldo/keto reductase [Cohnella thailandensis]MBB6635258.1 aldo/keto reductase [Cohnella thailandensis]MBP1974630.1 aryl-alcohol dehydrogenase-like predicted oxidoreductase [Cohnella thailandensis]
MKYAKLGRSGLNVSRLCLGTMNFGVGTEEKEAFRIMDAAIDAGINFFDTANVYGWGENSGRTEEIIGRWFAQGGGRREKVVLATKFYGDMHDGADGPNGGAGLSSYKLRRHLEGSLRRLQTDHIELYQMHHVDRSVSWDELWEGFKVAIAQGKIGYVGSSNFAGFDLVKAQYEARNHQTLGLVSEQHKFSLNCRLPELEVLPAAEDQGIGVIAWSPLDGGLLSGNALNPVEGSKRANNPERAEKHRAQLEAFERLCRELGESEANVALAWTLTRPALVAPIIGPRTLKQFEDSLRAVDIALEQQALERLDEIFPGPGGSAPKAYAW